MQWMNQLVKCIRIRVVLQRHYIASVHSQKVDRQNDLEFDFGPTHLDHVVLYTMQITSNRLAPLLHRRPHEPSTLKLLTRRRRHDTQPTASRVRSSWNRSSGGDADGDDDEDLLPGSGRAPGSSSPGPVSGSTYAASMPSFLQSLPSFNREGLGTASGIPFGSYIAARLRGGADSGGAPSWPPAIVHTDGHQVARWVVVALAPVCVWTLTWSLTSGLAHVADTCMDGMCSVARVLFPTLPVRGVSHEDVAVSLVKSMHAGTVDDATWSRPGGVQRAGKMWAQSGACFCVHHGGHSKRWGRTQLG